MAEEFIDDIIGTEEVSKTEAEIAADIQGADVDKAPEKSDESKYLKIEMGSEATPDGAQPETKVKVVEKDKAPETDAVKELAAKLGWREDHKGEDAVDASTYILKSKDIQQSMSQHNKDLKSQLTNLGGSVEALKKHNETVYQADVKKLTSEVTALKKERRAAIELADVDKVDELDQQIDDKQKDINAPKPVEAQVVTDNPAYDEWVKDNSWYLTDNEMAKYADTIAEQYNGAPLERVYAMVRTKVQEIFPDKFEDVKVDEVKTEVTEDIVKPPVGPKSPVESSSAKGSEGSFTKADLTSDQMQIMRQFVQGGIMTEEQYVNDIAKMQ